VETRAGTRRGNPGAEGQLQVTSAKVGQEPQEGRCLWVAPAGIHRSSCDQDSVVPAGFSRGESLDHPPAARACERFSSSDPAKRVGGERRRAVRHRRRESLGEETRVRLALLWPKGHGERSDPVEPHERSGDETSPVGYLAK